MPTSVRLRLCECDLADRGKEFHDLVNVVFDDAIRGYIEEDSVQALEQLVSEKLGVGRNRYQYWREQDGGVHILAAAMYTDYKQVSS